MVTDTDQTTESTEVAPVVESAPVSESAPSEPSVDSESSGESSEDTAAPTTLAAPVYKADYKIKVYDKETEIKDPFLKGLIKDAESEKKVKEIAQKSEALEVYKERHDKTKTDFSNYQNVAQPVIQYYNHASKLLQNDDLDSFFQFLKIPDDKIFKYAIQKAEEAQLAPDQRYALQQQRQTRLDKMGLEEQNQSLQTQQQEQLQKFREQELGWIMARPDVDGIAKTYNAKKTGDAPDFQQLVYNQGLAHYAATGQDLTAEQATMAVIKFLGGFVSPTTGQGATVPQAPVTQGLITQPGGAPPIIPNVTGRGTSPVKKQVRSIADLKKKHEELRGSSGET